MITIRKAGDRGRTELGWLDSRHTFSFGEYFDPHFLGFRSLRGINDDRVRGGAGFGRHPHRDMEILSWVLEGGLAHQDSLGNGSTIRPGDVQRMTAGTGVLHAEHNASRTDPVRFLQIWILPERRDLTPGYEQKHFDEAAREDRLVRIASGRRGGGAVKIHQDVDVYDALLTGRAAVEHPLARDRHAWVQVARGAVDLNGVPLEEGDGAAVAGEPGVRLTSPGSAEILLFDLA